MSFVPNDWGQQCAVDFSDGLSRGFIDFQELVVNLWLLEILVVAVVGIFPYDVCVILAVHCDCGPIAILLASSDLGIVDN